MFGRQIFLEPMDNQRDQGRNEFNRQFPANRGHGIPFTELVTVPFLRNDGSVLDLNFILAENTGRGQPNNLYFQSTRGNIPNRYLLEYVRQMEERFLLMERELIRAKMLIPVITRNANAVHQSSQTDVNWKQCFLTKYGRFHGTSSKNRYLNNQEQINVSSRKKCHTVRKNKNSFGNRLTDPDWMKYKNSSQNDIYPMKEPDSPPSQSRTLTINSTAVCSMHNIAVILPQGSTRLTDFSRQERTNSKIKNNNNVYNKAVEKCEPDDSKIVSDNSQKHFGSFETRKTSMEVCQSVNKKHEPEASYCADFTVKHEDHTQTKLGVNTADFRPIIGSNFDNDTSNRTVSHCQRLNTDFKEKCMFKRMKFLENTDNSRVSQISEGNRNYPNNHAFKKLSNERTRRINDTSRNFARIIEREKKGTHKKTPTPRSNVHTSYTPMVQSSVWNPMLDPNGFTNQLLRLAVLLYVPALMPALNSLIARQSTQTTTPVSCSEGTNDLLTQVFTILSSQQCVPNLPYVSNPRIDENSRQSRESNSHNLSSDSNLNSENLPKQLRNDIPGMKTSVQDQCEKNTIAVNTSLKICCCNNVKRSSSRYSIDTLHDQVEENEKLIYTWASKETKSSQTLVSGEAAMQCEQNKKETSEKDQENCKFSESLLIQEDANVWDRHRDEDIWEF